MRSANRDYSTNQFPTSEAQIELLTSSIPLPPSPEVAKQEEEEEVRLPPIDLHRVTGKKTLFESSDSDDEEETKSEPQVPVSLSVSEPRAVPDGFDQREPPPLPLPSSSSATLDAIKTRVASLINTPNPSSSTVTQPTAITEIANNNDDDEDDDDEDDEPVVNLERSQAVSAKFNRKRRKAKRNRNKKKNNKLQAGEHLTNENELTATDQEEAWKRHVAMQLQFSFLKGSNPVLRALTAEAHKKLGISQDQVNGEDDVCLKDLSFFSL